MKKLKTVEKSIHVQKSRKKNKHRRNDRYVQENTDI